MEESVFVSRILNEHGGDDYQMIENLLSLRSKFLANQFKDDVSHILRSNNREYYAADSECNDDFKKVTMKGKRSKRSKNHEEVVCGCNEGFDKIITKKKRRKQSETRYFSSLKYGMRESKNRGVADCRRDEGVGKKIIKTRRSDGPRLRVAFDSPDTKNNEGADEGSSFNEDSKKEIKKRKDKDERSSKPSKKRKKQVQEEKPELPLAFKEKIEQMEGCEVKLVIQKELTKSDVDKDQSRLSIPIGKIEENFLTPTEELSLDYVPQKKKGRKKIVGMFVPVLDPNLILYKDMCFKKWKMETREVYIITNKWNKFVAENRFEAKKKVQLWSFRCHGELYFALVKL